MSDLSLETIQEDLEMLGELVERFMVGAMNAASNVANTETIGALTELQDLLGAWQEMREVSDD